MASMFSQRAVQLSMRRLAVANTLRTPAFARLASPLAIATGQKLQFRPAATTIQSEAKGDQILAQQRRNRPIAPHLSIYQWQMTWIPSMMNRITGLILSGTFYLFGLAYLVAPTFGWHLESASLAASFAALPIIAKIGLKAFYAFPFTFHSFNGVRHLVWDVGAALSNPQVVRTGWTVIGLSAVSALWLTFF